MHTVFIYYTANICMSYMVFYINFIGLLFYFYVWNKTYLILYLYLFTIINLEKKPWRMWRSKIYLIKALKWEKKLEAIMAENFPEVFKMPVLKERSKNPKLGKDIW